MTPSPQKPARRPLRTTAAIAARRARRVGFVAFGGLLFAWLPVAANASPFVPLPSLPTVSGSATPTGKLLALPISTEAAVSSAVGRISARYRTAVVSFVPLYPVDLSAFTTLSLGSSAIDAADRLADILDGHIEVVGGNIIVIEPNFRVDESSAPLVPQVQAAVRAANGLAKSFGLIPASQRLVAIAPDSFNIGSLSSQGLANLLSLTVNDSSFSSVVFSGDTSSHERTVSYRPEQVVTVRYGATPLGSYDAWEQQSSDDKHWDVAHSLVDARAAYKPPPLPAATPTPFDGGERVVVHGSGVTLANLLDQLGGSAQNFVVDSRAVKWRIVLTPGIYDKQMLLDAAIKATQCRTESANSDTTDKPDIVIATPRDADDQKLVHAAVNRAIIDAWSPLIATVAATGANAVRPFTVAQFGSFATLPYNALTPPQQALVDQLFAQTSDAPTDDDKAHLTVTLRPAIVIQGHSAAGTSVVEQIGTIYDDAQ